MGADALTTLCVGPRADSKRDLGLIVGTPSHPFGASLVDRSN